jgi:hypothetical protein
MAIPHDTFLLAILGDPRLFAAWLRQRLPPRLAAQIDWRTLRRIGERHAGLRLRAGSPDLVYTVEFLDRSARLLVCFEYRSSAGGGLHDAVLRYTTHVVHLARREPGNLPALVLAAALSHGDKPVLRPQVAGSVPQHAEWLEFQPTVRILHDHLDDSSEAELRQRELPAPVTLMMLGLRCLRQLDPEATLAALGRWADLLVATAADDEVHGSEHLQAFWWYTMLVNETPVEDLRMAIENSPKIQGSIMTTGQKLMEQGRSEGRSEGRVEGQAAIVRRQLTRRFGPIPQAWQDLLDTASTAQLDLWADRLLDAKNLAEVFAGIPE